LSRFRLLRLCEFITLCLDLWLGWGLKQTCSSPWDISNGVSHSTYTHRGRVDSWFLVVGSQTANLTPDPSFCHNLCYRCPNDSCKAIFDIYTSITFQCPEERLKAKCFDPCDRALKFWESQRTPKSPFRECECHPHILPKNGVVTTNVLCSFEHEQYPSNSVDPWCLIFEYLNDNIGFFVWLCNTLTSFKRYVLEPNVFMGYLTKDNACALSIHCHKQYLFDSLN